MREDEQPTIEFEETDFGLRVYAIRRADGPDASVRVTNFVMPNVSTHTIGLADGYNVLWHVPIDDTTTWEFDLVFTRSAPAAGAEQQAWVERKSTWESPQWLDADHRTVRNRANRYLQDRDEMKTSTYTGMGYVHFVHDTFAVEGMGAIQDRTRESLGYSDRPIVALRRVLLDALQRGGHGAPHVVRDAVHNFFPEVRSLEVSFPAETDWKQYASVLFPAGDR